MMAERGARKPRRRDEPASRRPQGDGSAGPSREALIERLRDLELEREGLKSELTAASARIRLLESRVTEAVSRIDSILDSLHKVAGD